jgi:hypothetical protein
MTQGYLRTVEVELNNSEVSVWKTILVATEVKPLSEDDVACWTVGAGTSNIYIYEDELDGYIELLTQIKNIDKEV